MGTFSVPERWEDARHGVGVALRPLTAPFDALRAGAPLARWPVGPMLHATATWEDDRVRVFLRQTHLAAWGVPLERVQQAAFEAIPVADGLTQREDGVWSLTSADGNATARLLLPGWAAAFRGRVVGEPLFFAPHARLVLVCGAAEPGPLRAALDEAARDWKRAAEPVSPLPYVASNAGLRPWDGTTAGPEVAAFVAAAGHALGRREYVRLRDAVEDVEIVADYEIGAFPPDAAGVRRTFSFTRWEVGSAQALPDAEWIVAERGGIVAFFAPFADVRAEEPSRFRRVDGPGPPVWGVCGAPLPDAWARMAAHGRPAALLGG